MKQILNFLFNSHLGYFLEERYYDHKGKTYIGYIICRGWRYFGLFGYDKIAYCCDIESVIETSKRLNISLVKHTSI